MSDRDASRQDVRSLRRPEQDRFFLRLVASALPAEALLRDSRLSLGLRSAAGILFALAFFWPTLTEPMLAPLFAAYLFVDGAVALAAGGWTLSRRAGWPLLIGGCIDVVTACVVYAWPAMTIPFLANAAAFWAVGMGVTFTLASLSLREGDREYLLLLCGIVALAFSRALLSHLASDVTVLSTWIGLYALTIGVVLLKMTLQNSRPLLEL
jgi:uncharacterized membrane protein HdeD (DUF308 family)